MKKAHVESLHDLQERDVDALKRLGLRLQGRHELWLGVEQLSGEQSTTHRLEHDAPFGGLRAEMRSAQEDDAVSR